LGILEKVPLMQTYLGAVQPSTAASVEALLPPAITAMGSVIGRSVTVSYASIQAPIFYSLVVGPTRDAAKSTGLNLARDLALRTGDVGPHIFIGTPSAEGLLQQMGSAPRGTLAASGEARMWFARTKQQGSAALGPYMVELWDLPPMMALATRKSPVRLNEPTFSFAGATTLEWLELAVDETDFASGLLNRFLFFSAPPVELDPLPGKVNEKLLAEVINGLKQSASGHREFILSKKAEGRWKELFREFDARRKAHLDAPDALSQATSRIDTHAMRLALLAAAINRRDHHIEIADVEFGWTVARHCEDAAVSIFSGLAMGRTKKLELKIRTRLSQKGQQSRRELAQALAGGSSSFTSKELNEAVDQMEKAGVIEECGGKYHLVGSVGSVGMVGEVGTGGGVGVQGVGDNEKTANTFNRLRQPRANDANTANSSNGANAPRRKKT
jgi:hypothetical protein